MSLSLSLTRVWVAPISIAQSVTLFSRLSHSIHEIQEILSAENALSKSGDLLLNDDAADDEAEASQSIVDVVLHSDDDREHISSDNEEKSAPSASNSAAAATDAESLSSTTLPVDALLRIRSEIIDIQRVVQQMVQRSQAFDALVASAVAEPQPIREQRYINLSVSASCTYSMLKNYRLMVMGLASTSQTLIRLVETTICDRRVTKFCSSFFATFELPMLSISHDLQNAAAEVAAAMLNRKELDSAVFATISDHLKSLNRSYRQWLGRWALLSTRLPSNELALSFTSMIFVSQQMCHRMVDLASEINTALQLQRTPYALG